ncbi:MAG: ABC transporter ATP-binding protein [Acidobacteria bacterium]|nr:ABC transporter ATP-binding protein [Acidobacteriota bacterium]
MSLAAAPLPTRRPNGSAISIDHLSRTFTTGSTTVAAISDMDLHIAPGEFVCIVGASGCGKTTLLNIVAGLDHPTTGTVDTGAGVVSLMFQEGALFPWLSARENVELGLRLAGMKGRATRRDRAMELLRLVQLTEAADRHPHELSGGMRQRVSLARALAQDASVLLMDEPFGALDAMTRDILHDELERIWFETGVTIMFVTHNVREAARLGDRILVLASRPGRVIAEYTVDLDRPRRIESPEVSALAGEVTERLRQEVRRHADD